MHLIQTPKITNAVIVSVFGEIEVKVKANSNLLQIIKTKKGSRVIYPLFL
jgi:hypothetical protein